MKTKNRQKGIRKSGPEISFKLSQSHGTVTHTKEYSARHEACHAVVALKQGCAAVVRIGKSQGVGKVDHGHTSVCAKKGDVRPNALEEQIDGCVAPYVLHTVMHGNTAYEDFKGDERATQQCLRQLAPDLREETYNRCLHHAQEILAASQDQLDRIVSIMMEVPENEEVLFFPHEFDDLQPHDPYDSQEWEQAAGVDPT